MNSNCCDAPEIPETGMCSKCKEHADFIDDFLQGQKDAGKGIPHKAGKSSWYDRGYAAQYEYEQMASARCDIGVIS